MSAVSLVASLEAQIRSLRDAAVGLDGLREARIVALRLDAALARQTNARALGRPLTIAMLGGTGAGKSHLFNALLSRPELSPTSNAARCFTSVPFVAACPVDRPFLGSLPSSSRFVDGSSEGIVLCDTPDVDGMLRENRDVARAVVDAADIVVFVNMPEKYADFGIDAEVRDWAQRKRWFFVMNKADTVRPDDLGALRDGFLSRLRDLGFDPTPQSIFAVSAPDPARFDFPRLRETLFRPRPRELADAFRLDVFLGHMQYALQPELPAAAEACAQAIETAEAKLSEEYRRAYVEALRLPDAADAFRLVCREATWRSLSNRCGPFMSLPLWIRSRFSLLWTGYQASRLLVPNLGLLGVVGAAASSLVSAVRGLLPVRQVALALGRDFRRRVHELEADARHVLEEHGLAKLLDMPETPAADSAVEPEHDAATSLPVERDGRADGIADRTARQWTLQGVDGQLLAQLEADVERIAQHLARRVSGGFVGRMVLFAANAIPAFMLVWIVYRVGAAWWHESYLPVAFYSMALTLLAACLAIGFGLLAFSIRVRMARQDIGGLVNQVDRVWVTRPLVRAIAGLREFAQRVRRLSRTVVETRATLEAEGGLSEELFGLRPIVTESPRSSAAR